MNTLYIKNIRYNRRLCHGVISFPKPVIEDYKFKDSLSFVLVSVIHLFCWWEKTQGLMVKDLQAINIVIPWHPLSAKPHTSLTSILTGSKCFTVVIYAVHCLVFQLVGEASQYLLPSLGKNGSLDSNMPVLYWESSYFSQILKADLKDTKFPRASAWLHYMDDLLLHCHSQTSSQKDSIHLLKLLAFKAQKVLKEKLQFAETQFWYLEHLLLEWGPHLGPDRSHSVISFPKPQIKCHLQGFLTSWLSPKLDSIFLFLRQTLVGFTKQ